MFEANIEIVCFLSFDLSHSRHLHCSSCIGEVKRSGNIGSNQTTGTACVCQGATRLSLYQDVYPNRAREPSLARFQKGNHTFVLCGRNRIFNFCQVRHASCVFSFFSLFFFSFIFSLLFPLFTFSLCYI